MSRFERYEQIARTIPLEDQHIGQEFISAIKLSDCPDRHGMLMVLHRAYRTVGERVDLAAGASWVKFRKLLNQRPAADAFDA